MYRARVFGSKRAIIRWNTISNTLIILKKASWQPWKIFLFAQLMFIRLSYFCIKLSRILVWISQTLTNRVIQINMLIFACFYYYALAAVIGLFTIGNISFWLLVFGVGVESCYQGYPVVKIQEANFETKCFSRLF